MRSVRPKVPTTAAEWAAAHAELATENEALAKQLAAEMKDKEALAMQLAATVSQCADPPAQAVAAGAEGSQLSSTPRAHRPVAA